MTKVTIDCRHEACPIPLLKAAHELKALGEGETLGVLTGYMCAAENIMEWAEKNQIDYWMVEDEKTGDAMVYLKKK